MSKLMKEYKENVIPAMMKEYNYKNKYQVPKLEKIAINMGISDGKQDIKAIEEGVFCLSQITGQRPVITRAKKSIASFNLRQGMQIGCKVTLRGKRMYDFFYKLVNIAMPRIKDFNGVSPRSFDEEGNYTLGIKEQIIFPEISHDKIQKIRGMNITIKTSAKNIDEAKELLTLLGMPFKKNKT